MQLAGRHRCAKANSVRILTLLSCFTLVALLWLMGSHSLLQSDVPPPSSSSHSQAAKLSPQTLGEGHTWGVRDYNMQRVNFRKMKMYAGGVNRGRIGFSVGGAKDVVNFRENIRAGYMPQRSSMAAEGLFYDYYFDSNENGKGSNSSNKCTFVPPPQDGTEQYLDNKEKGDQKNHSEYPPEKGGIKKRDQEERSNNTSTSSSASTKKCNQLFCPVITSTIVNFAKQKELFSLKNDDDNDDDNLSTALNGGEDGKKKTHRGVLPSSSSDMFVSVGLTSGIDDFQRQEVDLVLLADISSSMQSSPQTYYYDQQKKDDGKEDRRYTTKLDISKHVVELLVREKKLRSTDRVALATFHSQAQVKFFLRSLVGNTNNEEEGGFILDEIQKLSPTGSTNFDAGLTAAISVFDKMDQEEGKGGKALIVRKRERRILVMTDAQFNTGEINGMALRDRLQTLATERNIFVTMIGAGVDFNNDFRAISDTVNGANSVSMMREKDVKRYVADFDFLVSPLVQNLHLRLLVKPPWRVVGVYGNPGGERPIPLAADAAGVNVSLMQVKTLFASRATSDGAVKGGIVLIRLRRTEEEANSKELPHEKEKENSGQVPSVATQASSTILADVGKGKTGPLFLWVIAEFVEYLTGVRHCVQKPIRSMSPRHHQEISPTSLENHIQPQKTSIFNHDGGNKQKEPLMNIFERSDSLAVRKGTVLAIYHDLLKDWIGSVERQEEKKNKKRMETGKGVNLTSGDTNEKTEELKMVKVRGGKQKGGGRKRIERWERTSSPLRVSLRFQKIFSAAAEWMKYEAKQCCDDHLLQEVKVLETLVRVAATNDTNSSSGANDHSPTTSVDVFRQAASSEIPSIRIG